MKLPVGQTILAGLVLLFLHGCTSVAQVTNLSEASCRDKMRDQLESILSEENETPDIANRLAGNTTTVLATGALGPRPFGVSSPSGADYSFFIQRKGDACLLRLYGRRKGGHSLYGQSYIYRHAVGSGLCLR